MTVCTAEEADDAPTHDGTPHKTTRSCLQTTTIVCIVVVFVLQMVLVGAVVGAIAVRSPENAAECERLVNWAFTAVCFASVVAGAAVVAQAWYERNMRAWRNRSAITSDDDTDGCDLAGILGDRLCGRVWYGRPQCDPAMCRPATWHIDRWQPATSTVAHFDASGTDAAGAFEAQGMACVCAGSESVAFAWTQTYTVLLGQPQPAGSHEARYALRGTMTTGGDGDAVICGAWSRIETPGVDAPPGDLVSGQFVLVLPKSDIEAAVAAL
ncbi:hypothetical protein psal_cds_1126 [Pandoravirus salinus]|uniref:Uncharacterized protein n=1 Tax=Pandoravirus salinus TaxID=1349410 RepID=S4W3V1_9VIRU|nr:hypothetical protein psal_cds_1126 [Pandoravirus salinus]AGO85367.1 hypothetical protein psal_cds_1126 [Pandoravirus salinus]